MSEHTGSRGHDDPGLEFVTVTRTTTLAEHWGLVLTYGVLTFAIGRSWPSGPARRSRCSRSCWRSS